MREAIFFLEYDLGQVAQQSAISEYRERELTTGAVASRNGQFISCHGLEAGATGCAGADRRAWFLRFPQTAVGLRRRAVDVALRASFTADVCVSPKPAVVNYAQGADKGTAVVW